MVANEFGDVARLLEEAVEPEDVFGTPATKATLRREYRRLAGVVHPDKNGDSPESARAFRRLNELYSRARGLVTSGAYGRRGPTVEIRTKTGRVYQVTAKIATGEICDLFRADRPGRPASILKVARHPRDNDLVQHEAGILRRLRDVEERWYPFLPELHDSVLWKASGGVRRAGNVLGLLDGFYSLEQVANAYPGGIDPRDMAWMWRRLLAILGAVHREGIIHGAVVPAHVLIHPEKHGLVLVDWAYALERGTRPRAVSRRRAFYPPELAVRKRLDAEADIYMAATTMLWVTGGASLGRGGGYELLPTPLRAFFRACLLDESRRLGDAWEARQHFDEVLERVYGPRRFRPFTMPATG